MCHFLKELLEGFGYELKIQVRLHKRTETKKKKSLQVTWLSLIYYNTDYPTSTHLSGRSFQDNVRYPMGIQPRKKKNQIT